MPSRYRFGASLIAVLLCASAGVLATLGGCSLRNLSYLTAGDGGDASSSETGGSEAGAGKCPDSKMVQIGTYCIDSTEVDMKSYGDFAMGSFDAGNPVCAWKTTYMPTGCGEPATGDPAAQVDWCDAFAYCAWKGKRLCGSISVSGDGGGPVAINDDNNPQIDEWYNACSGGDAGLAYPYGQTYQPDSCNSLDLMIGTVAPSGSLPKCVGGFPGLFDMSGNVFEWENACDDNSGGGDHKNDTCSARGGSFEQSGSTLACEDNGTDFARGALSSNCTFGFRCCSDLVH